MRQTVAALIGSGGIIKAVGAWAAGAGLSLRLDACWGGGLTAFHVAALLREPEEVAVALTGGRQAASGPAALPPVQAAPPRLLTFAKVVPEWCAHHLAGWCLQAAACTQGTRPGRH